MKKRISVDIFIDAYPDDATVLIRMQQHDRGDSVLSPVGIACMVRDALSSYVQADDEAHLSIAVIVGGGHGPAQPLIKEEIQHRFKGANVRIAAGGL